MTERATRLDRTSIIPLTVEDQNSEPIRKMKEEFESILKSKLKDRIESLTAGKDPSELEKLEKEMEAAWKKVETPEFVEYEAWDPSELGFDVPKEEKDKPLPEIQEADEIPDYDRHIATKVSIPKDGHTFATGRVVKRSRDENGELYWKESLQSIAGHCHV